MLSAWSVKQFRQWKNLAFFQVPKRGTWILTNLKVNWLRFWRSGKVTDSAQSNRRAHKKRGICVFSLGCMWEGGDRWISALGLILLGLQFTYLTSRPSLSSIRSSISQEAWLDPYREPNLTPSSTQGSPFAYGLLRGTPNSFKALPHIVRFCDPETLTY